MSASLTAARIAVLIPCLNEEVTISKVVQDFHKELPGATIYVFDNNSTDRTAELAEAEGAVVIPERKRGKGYVIASMFRKVEADYYVMVDGDDTYSAAHVQALLQPLLDGEADMTVATRLNEYEEESFRPLHVFGNNLVRSLVNGIFNSNLADIMSGYRGLSRELVQNLPVLASGFEVETEMTIRVLDYGYTIQEVTVPYRERPEGSFSKLNTFRDGFRVLYQIASIARSYKPILFFGVLALFFGLIGLIAGGEVIVDYAVDGYVNKVPTAILAVGCMLLCFGSIGIGAILDTLNARFREVLRLLQRK
ncbi:MAG: glycosyltransferase family 2 protein [SAR324 cluster bacterium]|nr:glycosyltransferase family 2 protein [SAR324 cluster bacterium]